MNYWLVKSEPDEFSIDDLRLRHIARWDGVRNFQARNYIRDQMQPNDKVFIYHSSCKQIGIAGTARIVSSPYPDPLQFDLNSEYFSAKSSIESPLWFAIDLQFERKFSQIASLAFLRTLPDLTEMVLLKKGCRLSVMPVTEKEWNCIIKSVK